MAGENSLDVDYSQFYSGSMAAPRRLDSSTLQLTRLPDPGGDLTSRSVRTVAIDPFTGEPIAAGGSSASPAVMAALNKQATGRGLPANYQQQMNAWAVDNALKDAKPTMVAVNANGQQVQPIGYSPTRDNPAVAAALAMGNGGNIKPGWANPPGFGGPKFPVAATPEIRAAYNAMVAGEPGAMKTYAALLADAAPTMGSPSSSPATAKPVKQGATGTGSNGYVYVNGQNVGKDPQYAGLSPSQMYDLINARAGNPTSSGSKKGEYLGAS